MGINAQTSVPTFSPGDTLTAANVNLLSNGIAVFSGSATRDAAFGSAGEKTLAQGQYAYLEDSNTLQVYDTAWKNLVTSGAWTAYTPTVTSSGGTITTVGTRVAFYQQIGKTVLVNFLVTITTVGTATGQLLLTLPFPVGANVQQDQNFGFAKETAITGEMLQINKSSAGRAAIYLYNAAGVFGLGNGVTAAGLFIYEAA
jgi:hypothetical protein